MTRQFGTDVQGVGQLTTGVFAIKIPRVHLAVLTVLMLTLLFAAAPADARQASGEEMELACLNWLTDIRSQTDDWSDAADVEIAGIASIIENDTLLGYCYSISPAGYVVVPVLKELPPIKVYSDNSDFDVNATDGFSAMVREVLMSRLRNYVNRYGSLDFDESTEPEPMFDRKNSQAWERYAVSEKDFAQSLALASPLAQVGPLMTTTWDQGAPYNNLCPYGDGGRTVVGCVATATAQILAYWGYPDYGIGSHSYYWSGDNSCGGSSPGDMLSADYSDEYDWANIPDDCHFGCTGAQQDALAELCYEVGVAFDMDYGYCGSGAYTSNALNVFPTYFGYSDAIDRENRSSHTATSWFAMIQEEINEGRPMQYRIYSHSINCDGWRVYSSQNQQHMNYGWDDGHNAWYTVDNLYCPWSGCSPYQEYVIRRIMPFNAVSIDCDPRIGPVPLTVNLEGQSDLTVDTWTWSFGDGDSAFVQSPVHIYETPGVYSVSAEVFAEGETYSTLRDDYIIALADSMLGHDVEGVPSTSVEIVLRGRNTCSLSDIKVPIECTGDMVVTFDSFTTAGCRTEYFESVSFAHWDPSNSRYTLKLESGIFSDLTPGEGDLIKLYFGIPSGAIVSDTAYIDFEGYNNGLIDYLPTFLGDLAEYNPVSNVGVISVGGCCVGIRGNFDGDVGESVNIADLTGLIAFLFGGGPGPACWDEGNVDGDAGGAINIVDLTHLVGYLFGGGDAPAACL